MLDNDTYLIVEIFQQLARLEGNHRYEPKKYIKEYKDQIDDAGLLFKYLGFAVPDTQSPLGWKPTHDLLGYIAMRATRQTKLSNRALEEEDRLVLSLLCDAAFSGEVRPTLRNSDLAFDVLGALGLVIANEDGDYLPTLHLRRLFADAYYYGNTNKVAQKGD